MSQKHRIPAAMSDDWPDLIFVDTEFSTLETTGACAPELISLAAVSLRTGKSLYIERESFDIGACSEFTARSVVPLLWRQGHRREDAAFCDELCSFVSSLGSDCSFVSDSHWDWTWTLLVMDGRLDMKRAQRSPSDIAAWPKNLSCERLALSFETIPANAFNMAQKSYANSFSKGAKHHALTDAKANVDAFCAASDAIWSAPEPFVSLRKGILVGTGPNPVKRPTPFN